jgi:hypothetical protein
MSLQDMIAAVEANAWPEVLSRARLGHINYPWFVTAAIAH